MAKDSYLRKDDTGKADQLDHVATRLPNHAATLGVTPAEVAALKADALFFRFLLTLQTDTRLSSQQWTAYKALLRDGGSGSVTLPVLPVLPATPPATVPAGIIPRFTQLMSRIKRHPQYSEPIGRDLGIIGAEAVIDPTTWKPIVEIQMQAGRPTVLWTKADADALEIWVDRGDSKGFIFLAIDTIPDYPDTAPLPAPGTSAVWKYRAIYREQDEQAGNWSDIVTAAVGG